MTTIEEYVAAECTRLLHTAFLLTGDRHAAEDLVQTALMKVWPKWSDLAERGRPDAYVRRTLLTTYLSWRRRRSFFERPASNLPEISARTEDHDLRIVLLATLARLPARQRATLVLRYYEDLSEVDTAATLGCSVGTVKSQAAKAMRSMRALLDQVQMEGQP